MKRGILFAFFFLLSVLTYFYDRKSELSNALKIKQRPKRCIRVRKSTKRVRFQFDGCMSTKLYRPRYAVREFKTWTSKKESVVFDRNWVGLAFLNDILVNDQFLDQN